MSFLKDRQVAIAFTGGVESTALVPWVQQMYKPEKIHLLTCHYGQANINRTVRAADHVRTWMTSVRRFDGLRAHLIAVQMPDGQPDALTRAGYVPKIANEEFTYRDGEMSYADELVNGRNMVMMLHLASWCADRQIPVLFTGHQLEPGEWAHVDSYRHRQEDFGPYFIDRINLALEVGYRRRVRVVAPFINDFLSKTDVVKWLLDQEFDVKDKTYSCQYEPACGKCDNCINRRNVFAELNLA